MVAIDIFPKYMEAEICEVLIVLRLRFKKKKNFFCGLKICEYLDTIICFFTKLLLSQRDKLAKNIRNSTNRTFDANNISRRSYVRPVVVTY